MRRHLPVLLLLSGIAGLIPVACGKAAGEQSGNFTLGDPATENRTRQEAVSRAAPPPPLSEDTFPCSDCHDPEIPVNREPRPMAMAHDEIPLEHDPENMWCLACHDADARDMLHLAGGRKVPFEESYRLCAQCHGAKFQDWKAGIHGRRTGQWGGEKEILLCANCHSAHSPSFKPIQPELPPLRPETTR